MYRRGMYYFIRAEVVVSIARKGFRRGLWLWEFLRVYELYVCSRYR